MTNPEGWGLLGPADFSNHRTRGVVEADYYPSLEADKNQVNALMGVESLLFLPALEVELFFAI